MNTDPVFAAGDSNEEIVALVRKLQETQQRLQELTGGEVDAMLYPNGHSYLLQKAQEKLRESVTNQHQLAETLMAILNALPAHIALLDSRGVIISVNEAWVRFGAVNALQGPEFFVNQNYLEICEQARGPGAEEAHAAAQGIRRLLRGEAKDFSLEYSCHTPGEERWFHLMVTPVREDRLAGAVVMHIDITARRLAETALRESEERFRSMFNAAATGIAISTPQGYYLQANAAYCRMLGYTLDELRTRNFASVTHPEDLTLNLKMRDEVLAGQRESFVLEKRYLRKNGDILWTRLSVSASHTPAGEIATLIVVAEDITEQKQAYTALVETSSLLETLMKNSNEFIYFKDRQSRFVSSSQPFLEHFHMTHLEELKGKTDFDCYPEEQARAAFNDEQTIIKTGQAILDREEQRTLSDGKSVWVLTSKMPWRDPAGNIIGTWGISKDITERKRTETRFRLLVDSNVQGVFFWNRNGMVTECNDAFLHLVGYTRQDLKAGGIDWMALTPSEYAHLDSHCLEEIDVKGCGAPYEKEFIRKDGTRVPILLGAAVFEDTPNEGVCFVLDLTERKKLEQQFLRAQRMESIGTLAGGIAHDLNNILAPILMSIDILKLTATDPQALSILETIGISARRGADIVRQVLSFARGVEGERIEVQPKHLLKDLEHIIKDTFPKDIRLEFSIPHETWTFLGDPTQIHQILLNLCVNARDAMPNGGHLTVGAENCVLDDQYVAMNIHVKAGRYVKISVTDSGTGIPPVILDKIFEPFFTTKELNKGTGLGLSTVMAIVKSHDGIVNVYSEPGKGTTFKVYLPALETSSAEQKQKTQSMSLSRGNGETVLVVDDEASVLAITAKTLQAFGYRVLTAANGAIAVAVYAEHKNEIAVILTDMMMPIMDGPATIHALMQINPKIKIIAASGLNANDSIIKVSGFGVKHFLTKPYTAETLLKTLRIILDET